MSLHFSLNHGEPHIKSGQFDRVCKLWSVYSADRLSQLDRVRVNHRAILGT